MARRKPNRRARRARNSAMGAQRAFANNPTPRIGRSALNRTSQHSTTFEAGSLIPVWVDEILPGDTITMQATHLTRLATPLHPIMDNLYLDWHWFYVPNRLVWDHWANFLGERKTPTDTTEYVIPTLTAAPSGFASGSIMDYLGLPIGTPVSAGIVNALPFRGIQLIWDEWFRAQDFQDPLDPPTGDGPDNWATQRYDATPGRNKRHDYYTSSLPWPQKGDPVRISIGDQAPLVFDFPNAQVWPSGNQTPMFNVPGVQDASGLAAGSEDSGTNKAIVNWEKTASGGAGAPATWATANLEVRTAGLSGHADLSSAESVTVADLREAFQIQRLMERDARSGTRLQELVYAHFGVLNPDARLQRPEYLGGSTTAVQINTVPQTSSSVETSPQGNLAAYGVSTGTSGFTRSFTEHGFVFGFISARADLKYQQGMERFWRRRTKYDFYWPTLAHLSEQPVTNSEIYYDESDEQNDGTWGYQERYAEYRYKPSRVSGMMRSSHPQSLDTWHLAQSFESRPNLNGSFLLEDPPVNRVIAVPSYPQFTFDGVFRCRHVRPMPVRAIPGKMDHF